jgi:hypothetical protein
MPRTTVTVTLTGQNANIYNLISVASKALKDGGHRKLAVELQTKAIRAKNYPEALEVIQSFVTVK